MNEIHEAAVEKRKRRRARRSLLDFTAYTHPCWETGEHHKRICEHLEMVERGEIDRLMIFAPPRHSKSELASRRFPAWYLGRHPDRQIITASYGDVLATDIGADVRDLVRDPWYRNIFPNTTLRVDTTASGRWRTNQGGIYVAAGIGGPIVGRGAHLAVIDDPIKSRADADSQRKRDVAWRWYMGDLITRLMPGAAVVLMMTRWHEDDLAGRAIEAEKWTVLTLPAIENENTPNEKALWPAWYPLKSLHRTKDTMAAGGRLREWSAQYQQHPVAEQGTYIKREWFDERYELSELKTINTKDHPLAIYIASDFAVTEAKEGADPDWTEHAVFGVGQDQEIYVLDWWSGRETADVWIDSLLDLVKKWKPRTWLGEAGVIRRSVEPFLKKRARERRAYFRAEWVASTKDKPTRGRAFQAIASMGRIRFPRTTWAEEAINQCVGFPGAAHDDKFDALSLFCLCIDEAHPAVVSSEPKTRVRDSWRDAGTGQTDSWKVV